MHAGVHQLSAVAALDLDDEIFAVLEQAQGTAVFGDRGGVEQNETFHGTLIEKGKTVIDQGNPARLGVALRPQARATEPLMKRTILTVIVLTALSISAAQAQALQAVPVTPSAAPGSPGTATPTPYPQITPTAAPKAGGGSGGAPLLPPIKNPGPPKDQPLPGLEQVPPKAKPPGV
ncbi:hypothetical protein D3C78_1352440 [compost metagenome]